MSTGKLSDEDLEAIRRRISLADTAVEMVRARIKEHGETRDLRRELKHAMTFRIDLQPASLLLRHLDAMAAPPAPVDREALGRVLGGKLGTVEARWEDLHERYRMRLMAAAEHLYQLGHAADASSRDGEVDSLHADRVALRLELANAELRHEAEVDRLTAERDEARASHGDAIRENRVLGSALEVARRGRDEAERSLAEAQEEDKRLRLIVTDTLLGDRGRAIATARAEGERAGREAEREACAEIAEACSGGDAETSARTLIAERIRARGSK